MPKPIFTCWPPVNNVASIRFVCERKRYFDCTHFPCQYCTLLFFVLLFYFFIFISVCKTSPEYNPLILTDFHTHHVIVWVSGYIHSNGLSEIAQHKYNIHSVLENRLLVFERHSYLLASLENWIHYCFFLKKNKDPQQSLTLYNWKVCMFVYLVVILIFHLYVSTLCSFSTFRWSVRNRKILCVGVCKFIYKCVKQH